MSTATTVTRSDTALTYLIGGAAVWLSYSALHTLARDGMGFGPAEAAVWPLVVDGLIFVATRAVVEFGDHPSRRYAWSLLWSAAAVSILGNAVAHGTTNPVAVAGGVVPPVAALAVTHLVVVRARVRADRDAEADAPDATRDATPAVEDDATRDGLLRRAWEWLTRRDALGDDEGDATRDAPAATHDGPTLYLGPDGRDVWDAGIEAAQKRDAQERDARRDATASLQVDEGDAPDATHATRPRLHAVAPVADEADAPATHDATPPAEDRDALARRVAELTDAGLSNRAIGDEIGKSEATVRRLKARRVAL